MKKSKRIFIATPKGICVKVYLDLKNNVYNVTTGENLYLVAILENGEIVLDEEKLVSMKQKHRVENIFLLKDNALSIKLINT